MKRLHRFLAFLPLLIQTQKTLAQDSASGIAVVVSPVLFTPVSVAVQVGLQFGLNKHHAFLVETAYPTFYPQNDYEKISYWRGGVQWKFYSLKPRRHGKYYAVQTAYLHRQLTDENDGLVHFRDGEYRYENAVIRSSVLSLAVITGKEWHSKSRKFFADVFGGIGLRHLFNDYTAKELRITSLIRQRERFDWLFPEEGWRFGYDVTRLHLTGGIKFGLRL